MARQVDGKLTHSSAAMHIVAVDNVVARILQAAIGITDDAELAIAALDETDIEDKKYLDDFANARALIGRLRAAIEAPEANAMIRTEHKTRLDKIISDEAALKVRG